jgi:uncharacterized circularly permuted ATP-grasp superfamily protein
MRPLWKRPGACVTALNRFIHETSTTGKNIKAGTPAEQIFITPKFRLRDDGVDVPATSTTHQRR